MLGEVKFGARTEPCVRVNSMSSGLSMEDLKVVMEAETLPTGIMLPKVETVQHLEVVSGTWDEYCKTSGAIKEITHQCSLNSLAFWRCDCNLKFVTFKLISRIVILSIICEIALVIAKKPYWWLVKNIGPGNGLLSWGTQPLSWTSVDQVLCRHIKCGQCKILFIWMSIFISLHTCRVTSHRKYDWDWLKYQGSLAFMRFLY